MANDLNQCSFIGRLGKDPEVRYTPSGDAICSFSIAIGSQWKDKATGEKKESTEWIRCVAFGRLGEICGEYLTAGKQIYLQGHMKTRKWEDKDKVTRYTTEVVVDQMQMLQDPKGGGERSEPQQQRRPAPAGGTGGSAARKPAAAGFDDLDEDIPF